MVKNNGITYLRLVNSIYTKDSYGNPTCRKKVILSLGRLSKFDDGKPDYVKRLKDSFKNGNPLISELKQYCDKDALLEKYKFEFQEGDLDCIGHPKLYSHVLIERILEELGLISLINRYKQLSKIEFDILGFFRLLVYGRILSPSSKIAFLEQNNNYCNQILDDNYYKYNVYDTLTFLDISKFTSAFSFMCI